MELKCPEAKELEQYTFNLIQELELDPKIQAHLDNCPRCKVLLEKWKVSVKADVVSFTPKIDGYEIVKLIGIGTNSRVYLAKHLRLDKLFAVKVSHFDDSDEEIKKRFEKETQVLALLDHNNIVRLIGAKLAPTGIRYLIFQYLEGETLDHLIPLKPRRCYLYMEQMVLGLQELHHNGLLLGDIKPNAFMVDKKDLLKIIDFGTAKDARQHGNSETSCGSESFNSLLPHYRSPEQCLGKETNTFSDIYSLGATFYAMVNGAPAFEGKDLPETLNFILNTPPPSLTIKHPHVSDMLDDMIQNLMRKEPTERLSLEKTLDILSILKSGGTKVIKKRRHIEVCVRCLQPQEETFQCPECGQVVCINHKLPGLICDYCASQKVVLIKKELYAPILSQFSETYLSSLKDWCTTENLYRVFDSIFHDDIGGFIIFYMGQRRLGLMIQDDVVRLFLYGKPFLRNLGQLLKDWNLIHDMPLKAMGCDLNQPVDESMLQKLTEIPFEEMEIFKNKLIYQEILPFLIAPQTSLKYISGKVPDDKLTMLFPDFFLSRKKETIAKWLSHLGHCLRILEKSGTLFITAPNGRKTGFQLEEQRVKMILFGNENSSESFSTEDPVAQAQISFVDSLEQDRFIRDGDFCLRQFNFQEKTEHIQRARSEISSEIIWLVQQPSLQFDYLNFSLPNSTLSQVKTVELVADYRSLLIALLGRLEFLPKKMTREEILDIISFSSNSQLAAVSIFQYMLKHNFFESYLGSMGSFESSLICLLNFKILLWGFFEGLTELSDVLSRSGREEEQRSLLEVALLLFPNHQVLSETLSSLYQKKPRQF